MSKSSCPRTTPKLDLKGLRRDVELVGRSAAASVKSETTLNSDSTSGSNSEDDDSGELTSLLPRGSPAVIYKKWMYGHTGGYNDANESDGPDSQAGECVSSSRDTPESINPSRVKETNLKRSEHRIHSSSTIKKDRSVGGLVASNDFFTPRPNLPRPPSSTTVPQSVSSFDGGAGSHASCQDLAIRSGELEPHLDSLRSRYAVKSTPRQTAIDLLKANFGTPRMATPRLMTPRDASNCSVGYIIKERVNNFTRRIQQSYNTERRVCRSGRSRSARDLELQLLEHGITPVYQPEISAKLPPPKAITDITDVRSFLARAAPEGCAAIQCHVRRQFKADWIFPRFRLYLQEGNQMHFLLSARKRKKSMSSNYILSLDEDDISRRTGNYFGKLRSNFFGTEFWFYDKGARPRLGRSEACLNKRIELGAVTYQKNLLGLQGPRKMTAIIPALGDESKPYIHEPGPAGSHSLLTKYKCGQDLHKMVVMHNKPPVWNDKKMCYTLNFRGRVTLPSVKNFQLLKDDDPSKIILQFGKVDKNAYNMDYQYPMSALQAFAVILSSMDKKIACE